MRKLTEDDLPDFSDNYMPNVPKPKTKRSKDDLFDKKRTEQNRRILRKMKEANRRRES